jgi:hypothetical protein
MNREEHNTEQGCTDKSERGQLSSDFYVRHPRLQGDSLVQVGFDFGARFFVRNASPRFMSDRRTQETEEIPLFALQAFVERTLLLVLEQLLGHAGDSL